MRHKAHVWRLRVADGEPGGMVRVNPRGRAVVAVCATLASLLAPAAGSAEEGPQVYCLQAFASSLPPAKCDPSAFRHQPPAEPDVITPVTRLYNYGGNINDFLGVVKVEGNATPGSQVTVTITDGSDSPFGNGVKSLVRVVTAAPAADPNYELRAGDFEVLFDPQRDLGRQIASVQELGGHEAGPDATPTMPDPTAADLGRSKLTVSAVAIVSNVSSDPLALPIFKQPATPGDEYAPQLQNLRFPPRHWCHYSGVGAKVNESSLGGGRDGTCSNFAIDNVGAVPDATWAVCTEYTSTLPDDTPNDVEGPYEGLRPIYCRAPTNQSMPTHHAPVSGKADDLAGGVDDFASEIAHVTITISQGETVLRTITDAFARTASTTASWGFELNINDFEPNYPGGTPYVITVTASDAWGNTAEESSPPITVYPY